MKLLTYTAVLCFFLFFFISRLSGYLYKKAQKEYPFEGFDSIASFYWREVLFGLFLHGRIGSMPWFILKKTDNKDLRTLYLVVNILTAVYYTLLAIIFLVPWLYPDLF